MGVDCGLSVLVVHSLLIIDTFLQAIMRSLAFNPLESLDKLKAGGVEEHTARLFVDLLVDATGEQLEKLATKDELKNELVLLRKDLSNEIDLVRKDLITLDTKFTGEFKLVRADLQGMENRLLLKIGGIVVVAVTFAPVLLDLIHKLLVKLT